MMKVQGTGLCLLVVVAIFLSSVRLGEAVSCNPTELSPCVSAITSSTAPTAACCQKLRQQEPCYCGYLKDPKYKAYAESPRVRAIASQCRVPIPKC
ncbi:hypothetical protein Csa_015036 [Cucumis sativus]|uniref:Bifunctional inhibitor/plant lipid transfer protein/seed storage helical domain-containing protein n=1 Tax=Cucumis sativus TaxID=3659 RepID=A0A0A0KW80_CUCSA|nr:hypothetical protein Csa_015036 [Cucumis sativus]